MSENNSELTGHQYDGIEEYNNPLPAWWLWTFLLSIVFGFHYWLHYEFGGGMTQTAELNKDLTKVHALAKNSGGKADSEAELRGLMESADTVNRGKEIYAAKCASCHGNELQGLIGPNLVDDYWIHGKGSLSEIAGIVRKGVLEKGMPAWELQMQDDEIRAVTVFIGKNRGAQPQNPKAPQGEKVVRN